MAQSTDNNLLAKYIPDSFEELQDHSFGIVHIYRHKPSKCPMAVVVGGYKGTIIGGIIYFREITDSMNMEIEVPMKTMTSTMKFVEAQFSSIKPCDNLNGLWARFLNNLFQCLAQKNGFTKDGSRVSVLPAGIEIQNNPPSPTKTTQPSQNEKDKAPNKCMICYDRPSDTIVSPCLHSVVCAECSPQLKNTGDAKICCQCRCPITGVFYPDNTVKIK